MPSAPEPELSPFDARSTLAAEVAAAEVADTAGPRPIAWPLVERRRTTPAPRPTE